MSGHLDAINSKLIVASQQPNEQKTSSFFAESRIDSNEKKINLVPNNSKSVESSPTGNRKRCRVCNKRLSLHNEYACKCSGIFCTSHRYPDMHHCTFDHRAEWQKTLQDRNPKVESDKVPRI